MWGLSLVVCQELEMPIYPADMLNPVIAARYAASMTSCPVGYDAIVTTQGFSVVLFLIIFLVFPLVFPLVFFPVLFPVLIRVSRGCQAV